MVKAEVIRKRLNKLDEYLSFLGALQQYNFDDFIANPEHYGSAERFLHLAIEAIMDMGNHIIADLELGTVNCYSDIPSILTEKGYLSQELQEKLIRMIDFRNTLVHAYTDIDLKIVFDVLQNNLNDISEFKKLFAQFL